MKLIWSIYSVTELIVLLGMINNDYFVYKRHILEYNYLICGDNPNTFIYVLSFIYKLTLSLF